MAKLENFQFGPVSKFKRIIFLNEIYYISFTIQKSDS